MNAPKNKARLILTLAISAMAAQFATAQSWTGGGADQNWSTGANWAGGIAPGSGSAVTFPDGAFPITTNAQGVVNNIVQSSTAIASLTYANLNPDFDTTQIPFATTLTVNGNLTVGTSDGTAAHSTPVAMTGGGSLVAGTGTSTFSGQSGTGNSASILDMSGLSNFVFNPGGSSGSFNMGTGGSGAGITLSLATTSNSITVGTFNVGNNNTRGNNILNLGNGTNNILADTINLGISKTVGTMQFLNNAGGGLKIASHTGTGRATITISGEGSSGATGTANNGSMLLNGGVLNMLASTMTLGYRSNRSGATATGILSYNAGIADVTTVNMGINTSGGGAANGTISVGGGRLIIGNGGLSFVNQGGTAGNGMLLVDSATVVCSNNIYKTTPNRIGTLSLGSSSLTMASTAGTIGVSNGVPIDNFNITNSTLTLPVQSSAAVAVVNFNPDATTQNTINVASMPTITGFPAQFPIISYQVPAGNLNTFVLGSLPSPFTGFISNNTTTSSIDLVVTSGPIAKADTWTGSVNNLWDTTTQNWSSSAAPATYNDLDTVTFDDTAARTAVSISGARAPASLTFNNNTSNYVFSGTGKIIGPVQLVKNNGGSLTLSETGGDSFSGGIVLNGGTLILDDTNSSISGGLTINFGTTAQVGNNDGSGTLPSGTLDNEGALFFARTNNISVGTVIPGNGSVTQNGTGTLTLTASNGYVGPTAVNAGTLALTGSGAIASSSQVDVSNATLDVSGVTANTATTTFQVLGLTNSTLNIEVGYLHTNLIVSSISSGSFSMGGTANTLNVKSLPPIASYPATNVLINAPGGIAGYNLVLGTLPTASPAFAGSITTNASGTAVLLTLTAGPIGVRPSVTWSGADASGNSNTNWSDAQNWASPGVPAAGERITFNNTATVGGSPFDLAGDGNGGILNPANINNIVDINSTNSGLNYANGSFHNTLINPGKTLNVIGALTVNGSGGSVSILGTNGTLLLNNPSNTTTLNIENGTAPTLDLSGLDTLNATVSQMGVAYNAASAAFGSGNCYLARTNIIRTGSGLSSSSAALVVSGSAAASTGQLFLGQTNALFVDGVVQGIGQSANDVIAFNPSVTNQNPSAFIRGITGNSSRVGMWSLGDDSVNLNNGVAGNGHLVDFTGGTVDAMINTLIVGQGAQGNITNTGVRGTFNMGAGNLDVTTLEIGVADNGKTGGQGIGIMNVTGGKVVANALSLAVETPSGTAGTLSLTNATLIASNGITIGAGNAGGTLSVINSTVKVLNSGVVGTPVIPLTALNLDGAILQLNVDAFAPAANIVCTNIVAANISTINLASVSNVTGSAQIPIISYAGTDPYPNLALGTVPGGYTGSLIDNSNNLTVDVLLTVSATGPTTNANITHVSLSGTNLVIHGTNNNIPNTNFHYVVLTATNILTPLSNWTPVVTNPFNGNGTFDYTNPIVPGTPRQFIDVEAVP